MHHQVYDHGLGAGGVLLHAEPGCDERRARRGRRGLLRGAGLRLLRRDLDAVRASAGVLTLFCVVLVL